MPLQDCEGQGRDSGNDFLVLPIYGYRGEFASEPEKFCALSDIMLITSNRGVTSVLQVHIMCLRTWFHGLRAGIR